MGSVSFKSKICQVEILTFSLIISSRDPQSLVKPLKSKGIPTDENKFNEKIEKVTPHAARHLILIRHGQYNLNGSTDSDRYLTEKGRKQAGFTGERLKALNIPFDKMIRSTMTRAQETGKIISTHIANIPIENCSLIEEGAPIAPQPPIGHWVPEPSVSLFIKTHIGGFTHKCFLNSSSFCAAVLPRWS